jgi:hypothetical protein
MAYETSRSACVIRQTGIPFSPTSAHIRPDTPTAQEEGRQSLAGWSNRAVSSLVMAILPSAS